MSETQDPETLGSGYNISASVVGYPSQPVTPSSTVQDASNSNLPSFGTAFTGDIDPSTGYPTERLLDISNWDYYEGLSGRLLERTENGLSIITSQPQYRPWESKPVDSTSQDSLRPTFATTTAVNTFADAFAAQNGGSKLPSFQSQFQSFNDPSSTTTTESNLTTLTNLTPVSPNSSNSSPQLQSLTTLNTNFHTLNPARNYPLVPAPIQAREIPSIQQQFLDERHIQLFHPTTNLTLNNTIHPTNIFQGQNGTTIIQNNQHHHLIQAPTVVTVLKSEQVNHVDLKLHTVPLQSEGLKIQNIGLHPTQFQNPMSTILDNVSYNGLIEKKINGFAMGSPTRSDFRKKERRKIRASSLESSATESDGASSNMEISSENSGQVAAISSTAGFKSPHHQAMPTNGGGMEVDHEISGGNGDKQVKKKRKRCGECIGCQRKDNCGDCAPCRNDKSHQICKQRRCEKLTEKKNLYNDGSFGRTEARRGRGKGRGSGTYRGRKPAGGVSIAAASSTVAASEPSPQPTSRPSPQPPLTMLKPDPATVQQPMAPMPFYADPNRFPAPVWQADPQGWAQGQFIQQIPHAPQPTLEGYPQQYPNPIYQATYQQPGFDTNTFYTGPVQVLTNQRPPSTPNHAPLTPRTNGTYTPSPSPIGQPQQNGHRTNISSGQYAQEYPTGQTFVAPATTPTLESGSSISRPNSVGSIGTQNSFTGNVQTFSTSSNFSPVSNAPPSYVGSNMSTQTGGSGNAKPGYPQVNSSPQLASHNSNNSGYSGGQFSGQNQNAMPSNDSQTHQSWASPEQDRTTWEQSPNTGYVQMQPQMTNMQSQTTLPQGQMTIQSNSQMQGQQIHQGHVQTQQNPHNLQQSPNAQTQQQQQQQQSNQLQNHQLQQQQNNANQLQNQQQMLNNQISNENFSQSDRVNLNSRIKTMILNKQQSIDGKPEEGQRVEGNPTGHFLSYSHHRRMNYYSDGGGPYDYPSGAAAPSPLENFVKFANNENYPANKWNDQPKQFYQTDKKIQQNVKVENYFGYKDEPYYQKSPVLEKKYQPTSEELANFERQTKYQTANEEITNFERQKKYQPANEEIANFERQKKYQPANEEIANYERQKKYQPANEEITNFDRQKKYQPANEEIANFERQKKYQPANEEIATFEQQKKYQPTNEELANFERQEKYQQTNEAQANFERQKKELNIPKFGYQENPYYNQKPPIIMEKKYQLPSDTPTPNFDHQKKEIIPKLEHTQCSSDPFQEGPNFPEHFQQYPEAQYKIEPDQKCGTKLTNPYHNFGQDTPAIPKIEEPYKTTLAEIKLEKEAYIFEGDGGPACFKPQSGSWCCRQGGTEPPTPEHLRDGSCLGLQTQDEISLEQSAENNKDGKKGSNNTDVKNEKTNTTKEFTDNIEKLKNNVKTEVPDCNCFPPDKNPPEPGSYYTHLGCASNLTELRKELENRIGISGKALRIEKICYTGKEGKTTQGCPMAKWIIRRTSYEEKVLAIVKHRQGHTCVSAVIVVCMVAWDGIPPTEADQAYNLLTHKLNRYGLPTTRRCATNEPRTCACQGLDPDTCGASFSFGCSWSMYYNGCKYARSKTVRKFRLSVKSEENEIEERMHVLATLLSPLYSTIAPDAFKNQCQFEREAPECRLGFKTGRPFSGVTACMDFTSHSHRDLHNMNNGCTVVATLTKHRSLAKPNDEQLHVLPLYVIDDSDEFGSKEAQQEKFKNGSIEVLSKYPCEVRVRSVPLQPCRRHGKKRKEDEPDAIIGKKDLPATPRGASPRSANHGSPRSQTPVAHHQTPLIDMVSMLDNFTDAQLQSSQVSSTVLDSPTMYPSWNYENSLLNNQNMQYGGQNQMYQSNQNWLESQKRQNLYLNGWGEYPGNFYKDGIKEDPDSTTQIPVANPNPNPEEKATNPPDSSTMMAANANFEDKNRTYVNTPDRFTPNSGLPSPNGKTTPNYPIPNPNPVQQQSWEDPNHPQNYNRVRNPYSVPNQNQCVQQQSISVPNVPKSPESVRKSPGLARNPVEAKQNWPTVDRSNWEQANMQGATGPNDTSPFRIPKARPPSRSQTNSVPSPDTNVQTPTFLKPYPPEKNRHTPEVNLDNKANQDRNMVASKPMENIQSPWPEELKSNLSDFHAATNYLNQSYANTNYGNISAPFTSYNPYNTYDTSQMNYDYQYAEKLKREEYIRNTTCYNSYGYQNYPNWCHQNQSNWVQNTPNWCLYPPFGLPLVPEQPKSEPIGEVTDFIDNLECFKDSQMGGVAIALGHGSVLFECAKHEMHSTTALRKPNRLSPTRISLVFYQHRNLNKPKHGLDEWEEKMRLRKLGITTTSGGTSTTNTQSPSNQTASEKAQADKEKGVEMAELVKSCTNKNSRQVMMRAPTLTTMSWTTLFPMHPCMVTGPYQEGGAVG